MWPRRFAGLAFVCMCMCVGVRALQRAGAQTNTAATNRACALQALERQGMITPEQVTSILQLANASDKRLLEAHVLLQVIQQFPC